MYRWLLRVVTLLVITCVHWTRGQTSPPYSSPGVATPLSGCPNDIFFQPSATILSENTDLFGELCSGQLMLSSTVSPSSVPICGAWEKYGAEIACWQFGINMDGQRRARLYNCDAYKGKYADDVVNGAAEFYNDIGTEVTDTGKFGCGNTECMDDCWTVDDATNTAASLDATGADCGGNTKVLSIVCSDINECLIGAVTSCTGPHFEHCEVVPACGFNTKCLNLNGGWTCECLPGYTDEGDDYDAYDWTTGCIDINECQETADICGEDTCQNNEGGYVCVCGSVTLWEHSSEDTCLTTGGLSCPAPAIDNAIQNSNDGTDAMFTCNDGYLASPPSPSDDKILDLFCREKEWRSRINPTCERAPCGCPPGDVNAHHTASLGVFEDEVIYTCKTGTKVGNEDSYTRQCQANGKWEDAGPCENINECEASTSPCPEHSVCYDTPGSYICVCKVGFEGPDCEAIDCGQLPALPNAVRSSGSQLHSWEHEGGIYTCAEGHLVDGEYDEFKLYCDINGKWSPKPYPQCKPVSCGDPGTVDNAERSPSSFMYGSVVTFTCSPGYEPQILTVSEGFGNTNSDRFSTTCLRTGQWSTRGRCADIDECQDDDICGDDHRCVNSYGGYSCSCAPGYYLHENGKRCKAYSGDINGGDVYQGTPCSGIYSLCQHGVCTVNTDNTPYCRCEAGYHGAMCDRSAMDTSLILASISLALAVLLCFFFVCFCCLSLPARAASNCDVPGPPGPPGLRWGGFDRIVRVARRGNFDDGYYCPPRPKF